MVNTTDACTCGSRMRTEIENGVYQCQNWWWGQVPTGAHPSGFQGPPMRDVQMTCGRLYGPNVGAWQERRAAEDAHRRADEARAAELAAAEAERAAAATHTARYTEHRRKHGPEAPIIAQIKDITPTATRSRVHEIGVVSGLALWVLVFIVQAIVSTIVLGEAETELGGVLIIVGVLAIIVAAIWARVHNKATARAAARLQELHSKLGCGLLSCARCPDRPGALSPRRAVR